MIAGCFRVNALPERIAGKPNARACCYSASSKSDSAEIPGIGLHLARTRVEGPSDVSSRVR